MTSTNYEIVVRGRLSDHLGSAFGDLRITPRDGQTVLSGELADQAHLDGVLDDEPRDVANAVRE